MNMSDAGGGVALFLGVSAIFAMIWKGFRYWDGKLDQLLAAQKDAHDAQATSISAHEIAEILETRLDEVQTSVTALAASIEETFAARTVAVKTAARVAEARLVKIEAELEEVRDEYRAHAIEDDTRFQRIETMLVEIHAAIQPEGAPT